MTSEQQPDNVCNEQVFKKLFLDHAKDLYRYLYYRFGARANPQDMVQEAFIKLWNNCLRVPLEKARAFLYTVANNQTLNDLAKEKTALDYRAQVNPNQFSESPNDLLEEKEYLERLQAAIEGLPPDQRAAFMLSRVENKTHQEIAEIMGQPRKTVEKKIYAAVRALQEKLGKI
jgi:RNA polymerase sigma-70 factor (ECF subfamily)